MKINLSLREQAIAKLVAQGLCDKCIAIRLHISSWTVATHLRRIFFVKLGVTSTKPYDYLPPRGKSPTQLAQQFIYIAVT
ncbi:MAG: helix-turn-helix transcriptional regulator [Hassallia sp. WJT32-NPBG1]|nr:helix-turn-helix transcriptional regulator [Hassallia sp. WJT32-NPBG1]